MTRLLEKAFEEVSKLSPEEQDYIAQTLLADLDAERKWDELLMRPPSEKLIQMARKAAEDFRAGRTEPLDPDKL